jgi:hypothetical protein
MHFKPLLGLDMFVGVCLPLTLENKLEEDFRFAHQLFSNSLKESKGETAALRELVAMPENRKRSNKKDLTNS